MLWNSPSKYKSQNQAKAAIDAYLRLMELYKPKTEDKGYDWNYLSLFENLIFLSFNMKYRINDTKNCVDRFLYHKSGFPSVYKIKLIDYVYGFQQMGKAEHTQMMRLLKKIGASKRIGHFEKKDIYETGLKVAQKANSDLSFWNNKIGDSLCKAAESRMDDDTRIVPLSLYQEAIPFYKKAGNSKKVKEVEETYFHLKKELKLKKFSIPLQDNHSDFINNYLNNLSDSLLKQNAENIFDFLMFGKEVFPSYASMVENSKKEQNSFVDMAITYKIDINNNMTKAKSAKGEKTNEKIYENYRFYVNIVLSPFLHKLFAKGIKKGVLTYEALIRYFLANTWLGQEIVETNSAGGLMKTKWIALIAPSLIEYFVQTETALKAKNPFTNYILCIDSLTLKFEGAIRAFAGVIGIPTTVSGKRDAIREKYIEELLADERMQKYFDENDRLFFNFLFVAKDGLNLRNNVAHSFLRFEDYSFQYMHLLICAFLRLGKYTFNKPKA